VFLLLCYHMACRTLVTVCTSKDKGRMCSCKIISAVISGSVREINLPLPRSC